MAEAIAYAPTMTARGIDVHRSLYAKLLQGIVVASRVGRGYRTVVIRQQEQSGGV